MISKTDMLTTDMVRVAEADADGYRESLLEMSMETDQLYNNYCMLYDLVCRISVRIDSVSAGICDAEVAMSEIADMIKNTDQ